MLINYVAGDLFANENKAKAFAIDCNIEGVMNTQMGIAFRNRYPQMYQEYVQLCQAEPRQFRLGHVFTWHAPDGMIVYNLAIHSSQFYSIAGVNVLDQAFREMRKQADAEGVTAIAMPSVGGGMGNLNWTRARKSLERAFNKWNGKLYVYTKSASRW